MPDEIGQPAEGAADTTPAAETTAPANDYAPLMDRMSEIASGIDERFAALEQRIPQPEAEPEPDPWANLFDDGGEDGYEQQPALDPQALQAAFQQAVAQANAPLMAQIQQMQRQAALNDLVARIPQLKEPDVARATEQAVFERISHLPEQMQQQLAYDASFVELVFKAAEAEKLASAQAPAGEQVPSLESANGAAPGGDGSQPNPIQALHAGAWQLPPGLR
jgi:hypothetical protein